MYISRLQNHVHLSAHVLIELISVTPIACKNHARTSFRYIYIINLGLCIKKEILKMSVTSPLYFAIRVADPRPPPAVFGMPTGAGGSRGFLRSNRKTGDGRAREEPPWRRPAAKSKSRSIEDRTCGHMNLPETTNEIIQA